MIEFEAKKEKRGGKKVTTRQTVYKCETFPRRGIILYWVRMDLRGLRIYHVSILDTLPTRRHTDDQIRLDSHARGLRIVCLQKKPESERSVKTKAGPARSGCCVVEMSCAYRLAVLV